MDRHVIRAGLRMRSLKSGRISSARRKPLAPGANASQGSSGLCSQTGSLRGARPWQPPGLKDGDSDDTTLDPAALLRHSRFQPSDRERTPMDDISAAGAGQLKSIIERIERLEEEKRNIASDIKDVYAEAKGQATTRRSCARLYRCGRRSRMSGTRKRLCSRPTSTRSAWRKPYSPACVKRADIGRINLPAKRPLPSAAGVVLPRLMATTPRLTSRSTGGGGTFTTWAGARETGGFRRDQRRNIPLGGHIRRLLHRNRRAGRNSGDTRASGCGATTGRERSGGAAGWRPPKLAPVAQPQAQHSAAAAGAAMAPHKQAHSAWR